MLSCRSWAHSRQPGASGEHAGLTSRPPAAPCPAASGRKGGRLGRGKPQGTDLCPKEAALHQQKPLPSNRQFASQLQPCY